MITRGIRHIETQVYGSHTESIQRFLLKGWLGICTALVLLGIAPESPAAAGEKLDEADILFLVESFSSETFSPSFLQDVFQDPRVRYLPGTVAQNIKNPGYHESYKRFLTPAAIGMARKFSRRWRTRLGNASRAFDVDQEIVVAILLVESSLGACIGNKPVVSVYASIMLEGTGRRREALERLYADDPQNDIYFERLTMKAGWAREQLQALLEMKSKHAININALRGSYAGAFGIPQFLPTSYLQWGSDGDGSNTIDLFYVPDAIVSVSNYLKGHGWCRGLEHGTNRTVLMAYNQSSVYVETVLSIARLLRSTPHDTIMSNADLTTPEESG